MTKKTNITVLLATCDRYETTLPLCLMSILNQSHLPQRVVLVDDSKVKKFYDFQTLRNILTLFKLKNIKFDYYHGSSKGATHALQIGLEHIDDGWVFKTDDDNVIEYNTLEIFFNNINDSVGAMSGIIIDHNIHEIFLKSPDKIPLEENGYYNKIENIYSEFNIQMVHNQSEEIKKVEHIYSNYFFKRDLADNYPLELTPSSHREETIFTYNIFRKGFDLLIIPQVKIYHLYYDHNSGNRQWGKTHTRKNELFFIKKLEEWNIVPNILEIKDDGERLYVIKKGTKFLVVLNN
jgi:glycosyltransferase involved in cell wall biosynthesis